jgi:transketolase
MDKQNLVPVLRLKAAELRRRIVEIDFRSSDGHVGGALSASDILATLFFGVMDHSPGKFSAKDPSRDRFVLSKGHISDAYYCVLAMSGYFPIGELYTYTGYKSRLSGHPTNHVPGIEINTGALGHGLSVAAGIAKGLKIDGSAARVFTLLGDGELAEGSVWEAAMAAAHYGLDNLTAVVDRNRLQIGGSTEDIMSLENLSGKWAAFGWDVVQAGGHDIPELYEVLQSENLSGKPRVVIARTIKGKGVSYMENDAKWHHGVMSHEQYLQACDELDRQITEAASIVGVPPLKLDRYTPVKENKPVQKPIVKEKKLNDNINPSIVESRIPAAVLPIMMPSPQGGDVKKPIPARQAVTDMLLERAAGDKRIVALTSDARGSAALGKFAEAYPERFIEVGIAEQNEVGIAAGLSLTGKVPFVCAPACFLSARSYEQVKVDVAYSRTNVKLFGVSGGLAYAVLGQSHHSLQDIAAMRSLPGMNVVIPADANSARALAEKSISYDGPFYIRVGRAAVPDVYDSAASGKLEIGRAAMLRDGKDAAIIACGSMVYQSLLAAGLLAQEGISVAVFDMHTIKPLDTDTILYAAQKYGKIITAEEHVKAGGLGSAVCETLSELGVPVKIIALPDEDMVCGSEKEILQHYGMFADGIYREVYEWLK